MWSRGECLPVTQDQVAAGSIPACTVKFVRSAGTYFFWFSCGADRPSPAALLRSFLTLLLHSISGVLLLL